MRVSERVREKMWMRDVCLSMDNINGYMLMYEHIYYITSYFRKDIKCHECKHNWVDSNYYLNERAKLYVCAMPISAASNCLECCFKYYLI